MADNDNDYENDYFDEPAVTVTPSALSFKDVLHGFCIWCASSILLCALLYSVFELFVRMFDVWIAPADEDEDVFEDVIAAVRELSARRRRRGEGRVRNKWGAARDNAQFQIEFEVDKMYGDAESGTVAVLDTRLSTASSSSSGFLSMLSGSLREAAPGSAASTTTVRKIVVKPWSPD